MNSILFYIILAQFFATSIWFASNAILPEIAVRLENSSGLLSQLSISTQIGFIIGTLAFAITALADRFSPSKVFFVSAMLGGLCNLTLILDNQNQLSYIFFRFLVGFFLAGVYPVGMKIAADHFSTTLGKSLGFLVAALVMGTAFPHFLKTVQNALDWKFVIYTTSSLSACGAAVILFLVPDGVHRRKMQSFQWSAFFQGFKNLKFRESAFGYFGHMWELYTFWTFLPLLLTSYFQFHDIALEVEVLSLLAFLIIGIGSLGCIFAGSISSQFGERPTALFFLSISGISCMLFPLFFNFATSWVFILYLFIWGFAVIADSPMFSTLVANYSPADKKGSSITIVNCIGFTITIISIQTFALTSLSIDIGYTVLLLAIGPLFGLLNSILSKETTSNIKPKNL